MESIVPKIVQKERHKQKMSAQISFWALQYDDMCPSPHNATPSMWEQHASHVHSMPPGPISGGRARF